MENPDATPLLSVRTSHLVGLLRELWKLAEDMQNPDVRDSVGICNHVSEKDLLRSLFPMWPMYSGSPTFPVPSADGGGDPGMTYLAVASAEEMWDRETSRYAALRWELLEFLIDTLERELERRGQYGN